MRQLRDAVFMCLIGIICGTIITMTSTDILNEKNYPIEDMNITFEDDRDKEVYFEELQLVPEVIRASFIRDNWKLIIGEEAFEEENATRKYIKTAGQTSWVNSTIELRLSTATVHEFGHYLHGRILHKYGEEIQECFNEEGDIEIWSAINDYSTLNVCEYFAVFFEEYIENKDDPEFIEHISSEHPRTYDLFKELENNDWGFDTSYFDVKFEEVVLKIMNILNLDGETDQISDKTETKPKTEVVSWIDEQEERIEQEIEQAKQERLEEFRKQIKEEVENERDRLVILAWKIIQKNYTDYSLDEQKEILLNMWPLINERAVENIKDKYFGEEDIEDNEQTVDSNSLSN